MWWASAVHDVVAAVLIEDRHVLTHRSPTRAAYPDVWDLPGGHIEAGESTTEAITRELQEELDIVVRPPHVEIIAQALIATPDLRLSVCRIHLWQGEPVNACPAGHDRIGWFTPGDLGHLDLAHPAQIDRVHSVLADDARRPGPPSGPARG